MELFPNPFVIPVGVAIGVLVAAPVGPVNVLCIQRSLQRGFWGGVAAGGGAVLGDALIALSAAMGVGAISGVVSYYRNAIQIVGGLALIVFGFRLYLTRPDRIDETAESRRPGFADYLLDTLKSFFLTVTNPGAVLGLFAIFGGIGSFVEVRGSVDALVMVAAVAAGSVGWWVFLSAIVGLIRQRVEFEHLARINRIAGILLVAFGALLVGEPAFFAARQVLAVQF